MLVDGSLPTCQFRHLPIQTLVNSDTCQFRQCVRCSLLTRSIVIAPTANNVSRRRELPECESTWPRKRPRRRSSSRSSGCKPRMASCNFCATELRHRPSGRVALPLTWLRPLLKRPCVARRVAAGWRATREWRDRRLRYACDSGRVSSARRARLVAASRHR
jgi:hypothetical protein